MTNTIFAKNHTISLFKCYIKDCFANPGLSPGQTSFIRNDLCGSVSLRAEGEAISTNNDTNNNELYYTFTNVSCYIP
jgi:hypothetical protein